MRLLAVILAGAIAFVAACGSDPPAAESTRGGVTVAPDQTSGAADRDTSVSGGGGAATTSALCVETYTLDNLRKREFAFDGTVTEIRTQTSPSGTEEARPDLVTFSVHRWFKGGSGESVTFEAFGFGADFESTGEIPQGAEGDRLLVAGDDRSIWGCGFTQTYGEDAASDWARVLAAD